jgi:CheY-like chemotaxis protein
LELRTTHVAIAADRPHLPRHSIAIVDDRVDLRELLVVRLGMVPGLDVVGQGCNGTEALSLARTLSPDLMTVDLNMPVMGGAEAIPLLRAAAPQMRIVLYTAQIQGADLSKGSRPDATVLKGANLGDLVAIIVGLLAEGPRDLVHIDLGRLPVLVAIDAFDSWVGLNARVREALATKGDVSTDLLGGVPLNSSDLLCLMGVFMQFGMPLMVATASGDKVVDLQFTVTREAGASARRALLALGGNGTLRAFNQAWSHSPTREAEQALDLVDSRLVEQLPVS